MKVQNKNNSSIKTRSLIKDKFAELLNEKKKLSSITVSELCTRANINRSTFYTHYDNIYNVGEDFESDIIELLNDGELEELSNFDEIYAFFDKVILYLKDNENTYRMLLSSNDPLLFLQRLTNILYKRIYSNSQVYLDKDKKLTVTFFVDGAILQILRYFRSEDSLTIDELNEEMKIWFEKLFK